MGVKIIRAFISAAFAAIFFVCPSAEAMASGEFYPECDFAQEFSGSENDSDELRLIYAAAKGDLLLIGDLISRGVDVNYSDDEMMTPLAWAARCGNLNAVRKLIQSGARVNQVISFQVNSRFRNRNSSALIVAARSGHKEIVSYLLSVGADPWRREVLYQLIPAGHGRVNEKFYRRGLRADEVAENKEIFDLLRNAM
jgi:hypothetical protein